MLSLPFLVPTPPSLSSLLVPKVSIPHIAPLCHLCMAGVITAATLVFPIVLWHHDEVSTLADAGLLNGSDVLNAKSPTVIL